MSHERKSVPSSLHSRNIESWDFVRLVTLSKVLNLSVVDGLTCCGVRVLDAFASKGLGRTQGAGLPSNDLLAGLPPCPVEFRARLRPGVGGNRAHGALVVRDDD